MSSSDTEQYLATLNEKELQAYHIARDHLGSTFNLVKSNGFREWKKQITVASAPPAASAAAPTGGP